MKQTYKHIGREQRDIIERLLDIGKTFSQIGKTLYLDRTTISKEVRKNRSIIIPTYSKTACENQVNCNISPCKYNKECYKAKECPKLSKPPYVCNNCKTKFNCRFTKFNYYAKEAQDNYENRISESKKGYDITEEDLNLIERIIVPLLKNKKQPINHIFENHSDILFFSKPTFYRYINDGLLSLNNANLLKKAKLKPRKNQEIIIERKTKLYKNNRNYDDYLNYLEKHPNCSVVEMDTVEGIKGGKCFLTLFIKKTSLLLIFLIDSKTQEKVNSVFNYLKEILGIKLYKNLFQVILTDNGSEFLNPIIFERDLTTGEKISKVFYCDPYCSWQKPFIERAHETIRIILPKKTSFDNLTDCEVKLIQDIICNIYLEKIKSTPYKKTQKIFPDLIRCLKINFISPDDIDLSLKSYKK